MGKQLAARFVLRGRSSVGRAPALQAGGQEFESLRLHCRGNLAGKCTLKTSYRTEWWKHKRCGNQDNRETNKQEQAVNKKTGLFLPRKGKSGCNAMQPRKVKQRKAQGGCLGTKGRRKTRQAAKSCGEGHMPSDPQVSEWGDPHRAHPVYPCVNT